MPIRSIRRFVRLVALAIPIGRVAHAQSSISTPMELTRLTAPVVIDGVLDDPAWKRVPPLPLTMYTPVFRGTPTQRSEIRVAYDDEYFYAAGWFYDTEPSRIRVNSRSRPESLPLSDLSEQIGLAAV